VSFADKLKKGADLLFTGGMGGVISEMREHKEIMASGTPTRARVENFRKQWDSDKGEPRWGASQMTLVVTPPGGGEPYEWSGDVWVRVKVAARGGALQGRELPVKVDPGDPQRVAVDWDAVESESGS
jgi:hypothetical protein